MSSRSSFPATVRKMLTSGVFLMTFGSCFAIFLTVAYASLGETPRDQFFTLTTLGGNMSVSDYYPEAEGLFVSEGETLNWNVRVYNHMGEPEYVAVRIKLLNATQYGPDYILLLPSPGAHIYEDKQLVADTSTWTTPLSITMKDVDISGSDSTIRTIGINGKDVVNLNVANTKETTFRFIIELWRYDQKSENFLFTWPSGPENGSAWNQIWIKVR